MTTQPPIEPMEIWAAFCGNVDQPSLARFFNVTAVASVNHVVRIHVLFQSNGGGVGDGICLYNFFRTSPVPFTLYNSGSVMSIATIAYLGANERKTSAYAAFNLHRTTGTLQTAQASTLEGFAECAALDDDRTEAILRQHLNLTDAQWSDLDRPSAGLYLSAEHAVRAGLAQTIADFAPPLGNRLIAI